jgi:hypothetical protein
VAGQAQGAAAADPVSLSCEQRSGGATQIRQVAGQAVGARQAAAPFAFNSRPADPCPTAAPRTCCGAVAMTIRCAGAGRRQVAGHHRRRGCRQPET